MAIFMTPREVADRWGCSSRHVRRLCASGELAAMRVGIDAWRIAVAAVEAYELARTTEPAADKPTPAAKAKEVRPPVAIDGFTLPEGYTPRFPALWPGHVPQTKKAAPQRH